MKKKNKELLKHITIDKENDLKIYSFVISTFDMKKMKQINDKDWGSLIALDLSRMRILSLPTSIQKCISQKSEVF